jgi:type I restriction enzyme S subunit
MSWEKVKLGEFLKVRENRFKPNDKAIADLKRIDKIDFSGEIFVSDKPSNTDMILIKNGDLVISGINVEKGAMAVYTGKEDITATIHYSSYSFDKNSIDIEFLKSFLKSIEFKKALKEQVPGGIKTEIKPKHILPLVVNIPTDINDQREVVKVLNNRNSKVDAISTELTYQLTLVKKLREQLLQDAVQGKLVEQNKKDEPASELLKKIKAEKAKLIAEKKLKKEKELPPIKPEEIPFEIPENWVWCRLGEIIQFVGGSQPSKGNFFFEDGPDLVRLVQIRDFRTDNFKTYIPKNLATRMFNEDDIMIGRYGPPVFQILRGLCGSYNVALMKANPIENLMSKDYCFHLLREKRIQDIIIRDSERTAGQTGIRKPLLDSIVFALPSLEEQNRIVQKLDELMLHCNELEASIKQSESQNKKLLQQVLREALRKEPVED